MEACSIAHLGNFSYIKDEVSHWNINFGIGSMGRHNKDKLRIAFPGIAYNETMFILC